MPSSQNDIGLFANVVTERLQEQIDLSDGAVHTLTPPSLGNVTFIVLLQAQDGAFRYCLRGATQLPTASTGMIVPENGVLTIMPADVDQFRLIRSGTDVGKVNVAYYTFSSNSEV